MDTNFIHPSGTGSDVQVPKPPDNGTSKRDLHLAESSSRKKIKPSNSYSTIHMKDSFSKTIEISEETKGNLEALDQNSYAEDNAQAATDKNSFHKSKEECLESDDKCMSQSVPCNAGSSENAECLTAVVAAEGHGAAHADASTDPSPICDAAGSWETQSAKTEDGQFDQNHYKCISKTKHRVDMLSHESHKEKSKKKHHKDAKFEGKRIPHLVKQKQYRRENSEEEQDSKKNDDYVLQKLFKKSGNSCCLAAD